MDVSAVNKGTTAAMNSGSATTTNANDLIFGAGASASTINQVGTGFTSRSTSVRQPHRGQERHGGGAVQRDRKPEWQCVGHAHGGVQGGPGYSRHNTSVDANGFDRNAHIDLADQSDTGTRAPITSVSPATRCSATALRSQRPATTSYNDTGLAASTTYDYTVSATDAAGNNSPQSAVVSATTLTPPPDTTPPTVSLTAPANGATVSGTINVTATASDNVGVVGVQFLLDGNNLGAEDTTSPYSVSWNTSTATNGAHVLTARARDAANNSTTSAARNVTVAAPDTSAPTVVITSPTNNGYCRLLVQVAAPGRGR